MIEELLQMTINHARWEARARLLYACKMLVEAEEINGPNPTWDDDVQRVADALKQVMPHYQRIVALDLNAGEL